MSVPNPIQGGSFQDTSGVPLASGYLEISLNQDAQANGTSEVGSGYKLKVLLDSSGNVPASPVVALWPNSVLLPAATYYTVTAYTAQGQLVWGPNAQTILASPSPFLLGSWIPNQQ